MAPYEAKQKLLFTSFILYVYKNKYPSVKVYNRFDFYRCYSKKMAAKISDNFGANLRNLTEKLTKSTRKYQKDILTDDENYHGTQHI